MFSKAKIFAFLLFIAFFSAKAQSKLGIFENNVDVGKPKLVGSATYDVAKQEYIVKGSGYNIWFNRDEFHYLANRIKGDFIVTADFEFISPTGTDPHRKYGWMVRENLNEEAVHFSAAVHSDGLISAQWRPLRGAYMRDPQDQIVFPKKKARTVQLERKGKTYTMRVAIQGEPLQIVGSMTLETIGESPYVGLFVTSHNADVYEEAHIWNVRIDKPVPPDHNFYGTAPLGSRLEIMEVATGNRKVIYESKERIEAPNWMPDGRRLLLNSKGSIWTIPTDGSEPLTQLNTGTVDKNNNDHVIAFDNKTLGISSSRTGMFGGGSTIYILPLAGGTPKLITEKTPSYLHGWSLDNKEIYFTGRRDTSKTGLFHIYKTNLDTGIETQLTHQTFGLTDGPEGSPDGKWIYYNGSTTGTMQIWRMKPDGSGQEQLTFDQYNNWFPHISPDGKAMVYISFPEDIDPTSHPPFKSVSLKIMSANGGFPRTIATLYGGQGTINTPSWSPDGKYIAFVSYSGRVE